jgi:hypothetical protein
MRKEQSSIVGVVLGLALLATAAAASDYVEIGKAGDTMFLQRPFCGG